MDCGTFEFVHVWKQTNDGWKMSRVISYGQASLRQTQGRPPLRQTQGRLRQT